MKPTTTGVVDQTFDPGESQHAGKVNIMSGVTSDKHMALQGIPAGGKWAVAGKALWVGRPDGWRQLETTAAPQRLWQESAPRLLGSDQAGLHFSLEQHQVPSHQSRETSTFREEVGPGRASGARRGVEGQSLSRVRARGSLRRPLSPGIAALGGPTRPRSPDPAVASPEDVVGVAHARLLKEHLDFFFFYAYYNSSTRVYWGLLEECISDHLNCNHVVKLLAEFTKKFTPSPSVFKVNKK